MIELSIQLATAQNLTDVYACDSAFTVESRLSLSVTDGEITYRVTPVRPYEKQYPHTTGEYDGYVEAADGAVYLAYRDEAVAGRIVLKVNWNGYGWVEDIAVNKSARRLGVGQQLMQQAVAWAKGKGLPGLMLETQNINVAACRFYERFGFRLKGFDTQVYRALMPDTEEVALYWYLVW